MSISSNQVKKIAELARLTIAENELESYTNNFSKILSLVEQMNEIDTTDVALFQSVHSKDKMLRSDTVTQGNQTKSLMEIAPHSEADLYLVPKVIE